MDQKEFIQILHTPRFRRLWHSASEWLRYFFRIEFQNLDLIPSEGAAIIAPNHSGYAGMDAIMLAHSVHLYKKRVPKMMAHRAFFDWFKFVRSISESFNLKKACLEEGLRPLKERELLILFPEAETGNFKSSLKRYQLQTFHSGFVRLALKAKAPIIPCLIIGAEESYLNVGSLDLSWAVKGLHLPVPINLFPLPAKWKIIFLDPISFESISHVPMDDLEEIAKLVKEIQRRMQTALDLEIKKRKYIYFPTPELFLE